MDDCGLQPNTFTYMALFEACNFKGHGRCDIALALYTRMKASHVEGIPEVAKANLVSVRYHYKRDSCRLQLAPVCQCVGLCNSDSGLLKHEQVVNRAIRKASSMKDAVKALIGLQHVGLERDTEVYNSFLHRIAEDEKWEHVLQAFRKMLDAGVPTNCDTYNALLSACITGADRSAPACNGLQPTC
jgi:pentatricopeptide repeat protein